MTGQRRPNVLMVMADQLTSFALGAYGHGVVKSPNIDRLAAQGVVFDAAYCNNPLCAPSRFSMLSGRKASAIAAYDNASYFPSNQITFAHILRAGGYHTSLIGKMHFVGADQTHGFEDRRTTDIYPADFGWVADWDQSSERIDWWFHNMSSVTGAGIAEATNQLDFDDDVGHQAERKLRELARVDKDVDDRPFFLCVSFTHPHDPYATRQEYWDRYTNSEIDLPNVPERPASENDPHSLRLLKVVDRENFSITEADVKTARRAYYGNVSYVDDWVGRLMKTLETCGLSDDTIVVFASDHGDMLGERGLWYKMSFFEGSVRVPLIIHAPGRFVPRRVRNNISLLDLAPTLTALTGTMPKNFLPTFDGRDLTPLLNGDSGGDTDVAVAEYFGEGAIAPMVMIRRGRYKYITCPADPPQLFDLENDPSELRNLAGNKDFADLEQAFADEVAARWDMSMLHDAVLNDQRNRRFIDGALRQGRYQSWDFQPVTDARDQYMRNHLDLNNVERLSRYPRPSSI